MRYASGNELVREIERRKLRRRLKRKLAEICFFDSRFYLDFYPDVKESSMLALDHFLDYGIGERRRPNAYFSADWYEAQYEDIRLANVNPIVHYILFGYDEGRYDRPVIGAAPVARAADFEGLSDTEILGKWEGFSPSWYLNRHPELYAQGVDAAEHYCSQGWRDGFDPAREFCTTYYLDRNPDILASGTNPYVHWIKSGRFEGRPGRQVEVLPIAATAPNHPSVIFLSHEASMTGAPAVLISLLRWIKQNSRLNFAVVVGASGPWNQKFAEIAPTFFLDDAHEDLEGALREFCGNHVETVYCNSIASGAYVDQLRFLKAEFITHVHEMESTFKLFELQAGRIFSVCSKFITVSPGSTDALLKRVDGKAVSFRQIQPFIPPYDQGDVADIDLSDGILRVFGCGTVEGRKGFDLFCQVAARLKEIADFDFKMYWIGARADWEMVAEEEIEKCGVGDVVEYLGVKRNVRDYFAKGDLFLLPSREDPYPLVCMEAGERALPIICFDEKAGGTCHLVEDDAGAVVSYLDVEAMAAAAKTILGDRALRLKLGQRAREKVEERHHVDVVSPKIVAFSGFALSDRGETELDAYKHAIEAASAVSFDIFDTLVVRRLADPDTVFDLVEFQLCRNEPSIIPFRDERMAAAGLVLGNHGGARDDVSIDEIYAGLPAAFDPALEKNFERAVCCAHPVAKVLYDYARSLGKPIVIASDMYLDLATIEAILTNSGYEGWDELLLSSDCGKKKDTGRLYELMKQKLAARGIDTTGILHIGDNWGGDIEFARTSGLRALHFAPIAQVEPTLIALDDEDRKALPQLGRIWDGFCTQATRLWSMGNPGIASDYFTRLGFEATGPLAMMMAMHTRALVRDKACRDVFFLARDGRIIKNAFDIYCRDDIECGNIRSHYICLSRSTVLQATLSKPFSRNDLYFLTEGLHLQSKPLRYFLEKIGLDCGDPSVAAVVARSFENVDYVPKWGERTRVLCLLDDLCDLIHEATQGARDSLKAYLDQFGLVRLDKAIVVDVGWMLNIQSRLEQFIRENGARTHIIGSYVGSRDVVERSMEQSCLLFQNGSPVPFARYLEGQQVTIFEILFSAPEIAASRLLNDPETGLATVGYKDGGDETNKEFEIAQKLHLGADYFFRAFSAAEFMPEEPCPDYFFALFKSLIEQAHPATLAYFSNLEIAIGGQHDLFNSLSLGSDALCEYVPAGRNETFEPVFFATSADEKAARVVFVTSAGLDNGSTRYRSLNACRHLAANGVSCVTIHSATPVRVAESILDAADTVVFQRCFMAQGHVAAFLDYAKAKGKRIVAEIDDLVLPAFVDTIGSVKGGEMTRAEALFVAEGYEALIQSADACLASTPSLTKVLAESYGKDVFLLRNQIETGLFRTPTSKRDQAFRIAYASGTFSHKRDFELIEEVLYQLLNDNPTVRLDILGRAQVSARLLSLENVHSYPVLGYEDMLEFLSQRSVVIVPLESSPFNEAKSNIKFLEAAAVGTAVIASRLSEFEFAMTHMENGLLVDGFIGFKFHLEQMIAGEIDIDELAREANASVRTGFSTDRENNALVHFLLGQV
ncbi:glycosyltransferase [uncultured Cohaesibacter sp.]|uniref:glycosyltransferase n=1 Tax=uncultured Cohaesibacter sp. TaxID=1002546 RepID=UPI0029C85BD4|nr:glycosyltransferase [uncultured Cohaesibacter sp.]